VRLAHESLVLLKALISSQTSEAISKAAIEDLSSTPAAVRVLLTGTGKLGSWLEGRAEEEEAGGGGGPLVLELAPWARRLAVALGGRGEGGVAEVVQLSSSIHRRMLYYI
jgi:hypothetical protein